MDLVELFGYLAAILVFTAFYMKRMIPLRIVAIASNAAFIAYAWSNGLMPILYLHGALLPLNLLRLLESQTIAAEVAKAANDEFSVESLLPVMKRLTVGAHQTLFEVNEPADQLYYVLEGTIFLPELQKEIGPGSFLGEFALFSGAGRRTATAIARTHCVALVLTKKAALSALVQYPPFAIHLLRLVTTRMLQNAEQRSLAWPPVAQSHEQSGIAMSSAYHAVDLACADEVIE
jgi:CRP/FNR family transcriptional regulator, cyclic AMP receptor protein